ncbi:MAG: [FeFe] hydrogenase H-cluster radical SAM maturase HydG [Armatimonadia bacterium]|nr:[FeFe] hydrogenase H-cluster radical SAM maturase HydG [Armatimonadia bacterium]
MTLTTTQTFIDHQRIEALLRSPATTPDPGRVGELLDRAMDLKGLTTEEAAVLTRVTDPEAIGRMYEVARTIKDTIYGRRLVIFAPLYISNICQNECLYCGFRASNRDLDRRALDAPEITQQVQALIDQGHKRVLLVAGEGYPEDGFDYVLRAVRAVYAAGEGAANIRRVNVNVAPLTIEEFRRLAGEAIGTYQLFQETYHHPTYLEVHAGGRKRDYAWRLEAMDRAMEAGIDDVGIGVLFGLADWRFEILAMLEHAQHLETQFGVGPHTISVPRLEPAPGAPLATDPPQPVSDDEFKRIVAILRIAVPYTGIILSTRESIAMRRAAFDLGVSQISAGSRTEPGGYAAAHPGHERESCQFALGDHRSLDEVIGDCARLGYIPSFCTACYRLGRTGADFMDLAKPGAIKSHCDPNALATFMEYLLDYASEDTQRAGRQCIDRALADLPTAAASRARQMLAEVQAGRRDVFC